MLQELQTALMTRLNSSSGGTLRGLVQGMWEDEAPSSIVLATQNGVELEESTLPFMVFSETITDLEQSFCSNFYTCLVQFTVFGDGNNKSSLPLLQIQREFLSLYGDTTLTMSNGYTMIRADTVNQFKLKDDEKMWQVVTEIEYLLEVDR